MPELKLALGLPGGAGRDRRLRAASSAGGSGARAGCERWTTRAPTPTRCCAAARARRRAQRGKLRIYFGAVAGVGKTYAMLQRRAARAASGRDVVVGVVETHGRSETAALLRRPASAAAARGRATAAARLPEFDLDGALRAQAAR